MARGLPSPPGWYAAAFGTRTPSKVLYLTFDDGPVPGRTDGLLRLLDRYDATATFFLVGYRAAANSGQVRRIARRGHAIGNHTYTHPRLTDLSSGKVANELRRTTRALGSAQGGCMRPPFGLINSTVARKALDQGLQPIMWTNHIEDWRTHSVAWHTARLRAATKPGAVILAHDTNPRSIKAVARMLPEWKRAGYQLKAIPACRTT